MIFLRRRTFQSLFVLICFTATLVLAAPSGVTYLGANMTGDQVVPASGSTGSDTAFLTMASTASISMSVAVSIDGLEGDVSAVHIHLGAPGENSPVAYDLGWIGDSSVNLSLDDAEDPVSGNMYLDIHTSTHPDGEIRGQIVGPRTQVNMTAEMFGVRLPWSTSPGTGIANFEYDKETTVLTWDISVENPVGIVSSVDLDVPVYTNQRYGSLPAPLALTFPTGSIRLADFSWSDGFILLLVTGNMDVVVHTTQYSYGEIGGQIIPVPVSTPSWIVTPEDLNVTLAPEDVFLQDMTVDPPKRNWLFVIDDTGSMGNEIAAVKSAAVDAINSVEETPLEPSLYVLTQFDDPEVTTYSFEDAEDFIAQLNLIVASGGGDCPEYAVSGIREAIAQSLVPGATSELFLFSDAGVKDAGTPINNLKMLMAELVAKDVRVHSVVAVSWCNYLDPIFLDLSALTGGLHIPVQASDVDDAVQNLLFSMLPATDVTRTPTPIGCEPLSIPFDPESGNTSGFLETITAPTGAFPDVDCSVQIQDDEGLALATQQVSVTALLVDSDDDGLLDGQDNCPLNANADQLDNDLDGVGDVCDDDDDNNGVADAADNSPFDGNLDQLDADLDGTGDACDPFPTSDPSPVVDVGDGESGVENREIESGVTLADVVNQALLDCGGSEGAGCMSETLEDLEEQGVITGAEKGALQSTFAKQQGKGKP
jgi:hypothetical protein